MAELTEQQKQKRREYLREWKRRNPDKVARSRAKEVRNAIVNRRAALKHKWLNIERIRKEDRERQRSRRLEMPAYRPDRRLAKQEVLAGRRRPLKCEICFGEAKIVFDHCHRSGKFRGWICDRCNKVLGLVTDSPNLLVKLAIYLEIGNGAVNIEEKSSDAGKTICGTEQEFPNFG